MAFEPLPLGVTPHSLRPCDPCCLSRCALRSPASLSLRAGRRSGLQASPAPAVSPRGGPPHPAAAHSKPCEAFSESTPSATVDPRGCATHTLTALLSPHGQPSVHPTQGAGVSEKQTPPGSVPKLQRAGPPPELRVLQGWVRWHLRTPCLRGSPGVRGASPVERQGARSLCQVPKPCGQGRMS